VRVAGIDLSTFSVDIVTLPLKGDGPPDIVACPFGNKRKGDAFKRTRLLAGAMPGREFWDDVIAIGIEEPWGKGRDSTAAGFRVQGAIIACLPPEIYLESFSPSVWKARSGVGGGASKGEIYELVRVLEKYAGREMTMSQDSADAYCIALATRVHPDVLALARER
jgi:hypothetical protein